MDLTSLYVRMEVAMAAWLTRVLAERREDDDRGDVPGWVLVTVMTAGLVTVLWVVARDKLQVMLETALDKVTGN